MSDLDKAPQEDCFITSRLWRGQEHFAVYWIAILLGAPYWSAAYKHLALVKGSISSLLLWAGLCGYFLVLYVGLWRAASRYAGRKRRASRIKHLFGLAAAVALLVGGANRSDTERRLIGTWHMDTEGTAFEPDSDDRVHYEASMAACWQSGRKGCGTNRFVFRGVWTAY